MSTLTGFFWFSLVFFLVYCVLARLEFSKLKIIARTPAPERIGMWKRSRIWTTLTIAAFALCALTTIPAMIGYWFGQPPSSLTKQLLLLFYAVFILITARIIAFKLKKAMTAAIAAGI